MSAVPMTAVRTLDPNGFYSAHDLELAFGLAPTLLNEAINAGCLSAVKVTTSSNDWLNYYRMKGSDVTAWMAQGCPTTRAAAAQSSRTATMATMQAAVAPLQPVAAAPTQPAAPAKPARSQAAMDREISGIYRSAVDSLAAAGMDRGAAVKHIAAQTPQLAAAAIAVANSRPEPTARTSTPRDAFEQRVLAKMATGMSRVQAAKAVAKETA